MSRRTRPPRLRAEVRTRLRRTIALAAARHPRWIRTGWLQQTTAHELGRLLRDRPARREQARALLGGMIDSRNPRAVLAALRARRGRPLPEDLLTACRGVALQLPHSPELLLELAAAQREAADDGARQTLTRLLERGIVGADVPRLVREVVHSHDAQLISRLGQTSLPESERHAVSVAQWVAEQLAAGRDPESIADARSDEPLVVRTLAAWIDDDSAELRGLGAAVLAAPPDAETCRHTAAALRRSGDVRLAAALADRALELQPDNAHLQLTAAAYGSGVELLESGWVPPERRRRRPEVDPQAVDYLLHSSLPHVSLGYSTRTHGLLTALNAGPWRVRGITRPGFPLDEPIDVEVAAQDVIDGVTYLRLLDGDRKFRTWPLSQYVEQYAALLTPRVLARRTAILHAASNYRNGMAAATVGRRLGIPTVYEVRGLWEYTRLAREPRFDQSEYFQLMARLEADACRAADRVIVITAALRDVLADRGVPAEKVVVVPNGVDAERFHPLDRDAALADELGLTGKTVIGYVGTLLEYEGLELLVAAAAELAARRDDFAVLLVGDGRSLPELRRQVAERNLADRVVFTGRVPHQEVERYYSLVDIATFPRLPVAVCELVSPLKPLEAMAMGKAVVVSSVAAMSEMVTDGRTGLVFQKGAASDLARCLRQLLTDAGLRRRIAAAGRDWVRRERSWLSLARGVEALYDELQTSA